jgi:hypothetical protein
MEGNRNPDQKSSRGDSSKRSSKRRHSGHSRKPNPYRSLEDLILKQLLKVFGIIFFIAVVAVSLNSLDRIRNIAGQLSSHKTSSQQAVTPGNVQAAAPEQNKVVVPEEDLSSDTLMLTLLMLVLVFSFTALILFAVKFKRKEIPRITVIIFYVISLLLARKYGWQPHILFPAVLAYSALLLYSGKELHSMVAVKWNFLLCIAFFSAWWLLRLVLPGNPSQLIVFLLYGSLIFLFHLYVSATGGFAGRNRFSDYTENGLIATNIFLFYLAGMVSFIRTGLSGYSWILSLGISFSVLALLYWLERSERRPQPSSYVLPVMVILSLILPVIFPQNAIVLFFATFSVLLLTFAKYSGNRLSVILAIASIAVMLMAYVKDWIFQYVPAAFLGNVLDNRSLMIKGLVAGLVIFPVMMINGRLVRKLHVDFSKDWFSRSTYQRIFKGLNLIVLYLSGYWVVNYFIMVLSASSDMNFMSWFAYNCAFFLVTIPSIAAQKSKFLTQAAGFAIFFSLAYPTLIHVTNVNIRNELLIHEHLDRIAFWFHYPVVILFIAEIILLSAYLSKAFESQAMIRKIFSIYLLVMILFILLSEYDHLSIWFGMKKGVTVEEIILANRALPYTIILIIFSLALLGYGLFARNSLLRVAGLAALLATLGKILYIDIRTVGGTTRSVLLFAVGTIVLVISFMYPRMKRYFRHAEHQRKGMSRHRRSSRRKNTSIPASVANASTDEASQHQDQR